MWPRAPCAPTAARPGRARGGDPRGGPRRRRDPSALPEALIALRPPLRRRRAASGSKADVQAAVVRVVELRVDRALVAARREEPLGAAAVRPLDPDVFVVDVHDRVA